MTAWKHESEGELSGQTGGRVLQLITNICHSARVGNCNISHLREGMNGTGAARQVDM